MFTLYNKLTKHNDITARGFGYMIGTGVDILVVLAVVEYMSRTVIS